MNYQHQFHAGNAADCSKHLALVLALELLGKKDKPLFFMDTHGGAGRYELRFAAEARQGVHRLWEQRRNLPALGPWLDLLARENPGGTLTSYLGSPLLAARMLRPQDRMVVGELVPAVATRLRQELQRRPNTSVLAEDGYALLRGHLPPREGRGLVLIDPPYERADEWERLTEALLEARQRWPQGSFLLWYPRKNRAKIARLWQDLRRQMEFQVIELAFAEESGVERMTGSGLCFIRPPWGLLDRLLPAYHAMGPCLSEAGYWGIQVQNFAKLPGSYGGKMAKEEKKGS
ncbi:MAG: 23S rRNA (adenine(2030)-N(6))-methyltransferase RlmJ [Acidithiobacillus sp.]|nr:23S rRNA (adenine(2030)-N(6))-methyltransferase RlmJ [Acidithiobacillus sp.]